MVVKVNFRKHNKTMVFNSLSLEYVRFAERESQKIVKQSKYKSNYKVGETHSYFGAHGQ